jgi:O-antigen ligase
VGRGRKAAAARTGGPAQAPPLPAVPEESPGLLLGVSIGLLAIAGMALASGGYSYGGYQLGFVILPLGAAVAWAGRVARSRFVIGVFAASFLLLAAFSNPGRVAWYYAAHIPLAWIVGWTALNHVPSRARLILSVVVGTAVASALYSWALWLGSGRIDYRMEGTFGLHNAYAGYLLLAWPTAALAALRSPRLTGRALFGAAALLLVVTLVLTYSRAAIAVLALQLLCLGVYALLQLRGSLATPRGRRITMFSAAGAVLGVVALFALPGVRGTVAAMGDFGGYSMQGRLRFWDAAWRMFLDHPLTGIGLGNFGSRFPQYQRDWVYYSNDPHSWLLQLPAELGVPGLLLVLALLVGLVIWARRLWRGARCRPAALLLIVAVFGSAAHAGFDFDYTFGATTALLGLLLAYGTWLATGEPSSAGDVVPEAGTVLTPAAAGVPVKHSAWGGARWATVGLFTLAALAGQLLTLERSVLDNLRGAQLSPEAREAQLRQAIGFNPGNPVTRYQLATVLAGRGSGSTRVEALEQADTAVKLNPWYADAWALRALLAQDKQQAAADAERAVRLDPWNSPDLYWYWATLAPDDETRRERLELGALKLGITAPITPQHVRPEWYKLNPMLGEWWFELARLTTDPELKQQYARRAEEFRSYVKEKMTDPEADVRSSPSDV